MLMQVLKEVVKSSIFAEICNHGKTEKQPSDILDCFNHHAGNRFYRNWISMVYPKAGK